MQQLSEFPRPGKKEHTVLHKTTQMTLRARMLLDPMLPDKDITPSQGNILGYLYRHCGEGETDPYRTVPQQSQRGNAGNCGLCNYRLRR